MLVLKNTLSSSIAQAIPTTAPWQQPFLGPFFPTGFWTRFSCCHVPWEPVYLKLNLQYHGGKCHRPDPSPTLGLMTESQTMYRIQDCIQTYHSNTQSSLTIWQPDNIEVFNAWLMKCIHDSAGWPLQTLVCPALCT